MTHHTLVIHRSCFNSARARCDCTRIGMVGLLIVLASLGMGASAPHAYAVGHPIDVASRVPVAELVHSDGTLDLRQGINAMLDLSGWNMTLDPTLGPVLAPQVAGTWSALGSGLDNTVFAMVVSGGNVYVGGHFSDAGGNPNADRIAVWNGSAWEAFGSGLSNTVYAIAVSEGNVYVGGGFTDAGGVSEADSIAVWNGSGWEAFGSGLNGVVYAISVSEGDVYAGGAFTDAGDDANADKIAVWNGSYWSALGPGLNNTVSAIAVSEGNVYAGGAFTDAGGNANADKIAMWNGSAWSALGSGLNESVFAIVTSGSNVYVGGVFTDAGDDENADHIALWDGSAWSALGTGLNSWVNAIAISGSDVYASGEFTDAGGDLDGDRIALWHAGSWWPLGPGLNDSVYAVTAVGSNVYAAGNFADAGGNANADRIALFVPTTLVYAEPSGSCSGNTPCYASLHNAIRAVAPGGEVRYYGGAYWESVSLSKNATVTFVGSSDAVIIGTLYIGTGTFNAPGAYTFRVTENFMIWGGIFNHNNGTVAFALGPDERNLDAKVPITFNNLIVNTGVTLSETVAADNVTVNGTLTNNGTIRKSQSIGGTGSYTFGLAGGPINGVNLSINVTEDNFTSIQVDRMDSNHPSATTGIQTGYYWDITPSGSGAVNLTLPVTFTPDSLDKLCRYTGVGQVWDCAMNSFTSNTLTRNDVATFSAWAAGNNVGPTAVELSSLKAYSLVGRLHVSIVFAGLALIVCIGLILINRKRPTSG